MTTVTDPNSRKALTMYRLSEHSLAIEKGRRRQTWISREDRLCSHCPQNEVETELQFLTSCQICDHIREKYFPQTSQTHKEYEKQITFWLPYLLGEIPQCASQQQDLWPVATRKEQPVKNKCHCNTTHIYVAYLFPPFLTWTICTSLQHCILYRHNRTFEMSLFFWNLCECNIYCSRFFLLYWETEREKKERER